MRVSGWRFYGGRYGVDLYEVASGIRLAAFNEKAFDMDSDGMFVNTEWIGDRYFVMPIKRTLRKLLFCDVDCAPRVKSHKRSIHRKALRRKLTVRMICFVLRRPYRRHAFILKL